MNVIYLDFTIKLDNNQSIVSKDSDDDYFNLEISSGRASMSIRLSASQAKDLGNYLLKKPRNHRDTAFPVDLTATGG